MASLGGGERLRGAPLGEAERRNRPQDAWMLEGHRQCERGGELALGPVEVPHSAEHLREHPAASALFQTIVMRVSILAQLGCKGTGLVERTAVGA